MPVEINSRVFTYGQMTLEDPSPDMTPAEVLEFYAGIYDELSNGVVEGPEISDDGKITFTLKKAVGTKGTSISINDILKGTIPFPFDQGKGQPDFRFMEDVAAALNTDDGDPFAAPSGAILLL